MPQRQQPPRKIALKGPAAPAKLVRQIVRGTSRLGQLHQSEEPIGGRREARVRRVARYGASARNLPADHRVECVGRQYSLEPPIQLYLACARDTARRCLR